MKVPENSFKCEFLNIDIYIQKNIYKKMNRKNSLVRFFDIKLNKTQRQKINARRSINFL